MSRDTTNRYAYVRNSPLNYRDPSGHFILPLAIAGIAIGSAYISHNGYQIAYWGLAVASPAVESFNAYGDRVVPPASGEVATPWLIDQMKSNARGTATQLMRENWESELPHRMAGALAGWNALVRTGAVWDFKRDLREAGIETVTLGGQELNYQAVANIHYGFVGRAAGFGAEVLRSGAGIAQLKWYLKGKPDNVGPFAYQNSSGDWTRAYYDQPFDAWCVMFGIFLYDQYGSDLDGLTEDVFTQALQQFIEQYGEPPSVD